MKTEGPSKPIIVIGGGGHSRSLIAAMAGGPIVFAGYTDFSDNGALGGVSYLGQDDVIDARKTDFDLAIGITYLGSPKDLSLRRSLISRFEKSFDFPLLIAPTANVDSSTEIGKGTVIMKEALVNVDARIGNFGIINSGVLIEHECQLADHVTISSGTTLGGGVEIGEGTFIGLGATILNGIKIGSNCLIAAGAVVVNNLESGSIVRGVPAKPFGD